MFLLLAQTIHKFKKKKKHGQKGNNATFRKTFIEPIVTISQLSELRSTEMSCFAKVT